jgi:hypothetical protein
MRPLNEPVGKWNLDESGTTWMDAAAHFVPAATVDPSLTARHVLDRALAHQVGAVVHVAEDGRPIGVSTLDDVTPGADGP